MFAVLFSYYGLDWASSIIGLLGLYLVSEKRRLGFLFTAASVILAAVVAVMAAQYGFLIANSATLLLAIRGYLKWKDT